MKKERMKERERERERERVAKKRRRNSSIVKKKHVKGSSCQLVNSSSKISLFLFSNFNQYIL